jgi:cell division protein FtsW (lipid II flippase)
MKRRILSGLGCVIFALVLVFIVTSFSKDEIFNRWFAILLTASSFIVGVFIPRVGKQATKLAVGWIAAGNHSGIQSARVSEMLAHDNYEALNDSYYTSPKVGVAIIVIVLVLLGLILFV